MTKTSFSMKPEEELLAARGLESRDTVQKFIDSEVLRLRLPTFLSRLGISCAPAPWVP